MMDSSSRRGGDVALREEPKHEAASFNETELDPRLPIPGGNYFWKLSLTQRNKRYMRGSPPGAYIA